MNDDENENSEKEKADKKRKRLEDRSAAMRKLSKRLSKEAALLAPKKKPKAKRIVCGRLVK